jgi:hypothetical protein
MGSSSHARGDVVRGYSVINLGVVEALESRRLFAGEAVTQLILINADTDQPIREITNGDVINFELLGTNRLNVLAEVEGTTQSVRFALDSRTNYRTENSAPYSLAGDTDGDYKPWTPSLGSHTLRATPYSADNAGGTAGVAREVTFQVIDQPVADPVAVQASAGSLAFGSIDVGSFDQATVTLTNPTAPGGSSVTIQSTDIAGAAAFSDDFNDAGDVTLAPGASLTLTVRFTPTAGGSASGTLNVRHTGTNSPLPISLAGSGLAANVAPVLAPVGSRTVTSGTTLTVPVSASDPDGDAITLSASNLPAWAVFTDNGNGTGSLVLSPPAGTSATANGVVITASDDGEPVMSDAETINVTVSETGVILYGLTLINADTDQPVGPLGDVVNFALIGTRNLNLRADTSAGTKSVRFALDSTSNFRTENSAPYSFAGDTNGNYAPWTPSLGTHTIRATPYSGTSASGTAGAAFTKQFTVVEGATLTASSTLAVSAAQGGAVANRTITLGTNDGATGVAYTATSNAHWLTVLNPSGTTNEPLSIRVNTTGLPLGAHPGYITVKSPTHGGIRIAVTLTVTGSFVADQIHLSFVQDPSSTMTVVWRTMNTATPSVVEYRALGGSAWLSRTGGRRDSGTTGTLHETTLSGLSPATTYEYRVRGDNSAWSPVFTTRTMPAPGPADFDLVFFGDTGLTGRLDGLDTGTAQAIAEMIKLDPDLLLPGGDYAYYNTDTRFGSLNNSIDAWFNQNQTLFSRVPIMPTYGNHEVLLGESYDAWADRFATPQGWNGQQNFSFDVGDVHFVSIFAVHDTAGLSSSSLAWIDNDMAAARAAEARWIVPYMHVPPFSDGTSHPANTTLRAQLGPIFERHDVAVALASHDQSYERTYPLTGVPSNIATTSASLSSYDATDGVTWIKVSPAGKLSNRAGVNDFSKFRTNPPPFWTASRDDTMHHFSRLVFSAEGTLRVETYGFHGDGRPATIIDSFEYDLGASSGELVDEGVVVTARATEPGAEWVGADFVWDREDSAADADEADETEDEELLVAAV